MSKNMLREIEKKITRYVQKDLPRQAGKMAVDEFRENFHRQGFRNNGITPWQEVERRKKGSPWYGFQYKGEKRTSVRYVRSKKTGKTRRSKTQKKLNFSNAATQRGILIGPGANLMNSITVFEANEKQVRVGSDLPYAEVHNEGGYIKVFGKAVKKLPRRQFIGESQELMLALQDKLLENVDRITDEVSDKYSK